MKIENDEHKIDKEIVSVPNAILLFLLKKIISHMDIKHGSSAFSSEKMFQKYWKIETIPNVPLYASLIILSVV